MHIGLATYTPDYFVEAGSLAIYTPDYFVEAGIWLHLAVSVTQDKEIACLISNKYTVISNMTTFSH